MATILEEVKTRFHSGSSIARIIIINVVIFLISLIFKLILTFGLQEGTMIRSAFQSYENILAVPLDLGNVLFRPWTIITYMFFHYDIGHILWNMIYFYWFGQLLASQIGNSKITPIYVYGGLAGYLLATLFYHAFPLLPIGGYMLGASGAVYAIMIAAVMINPQYRLNLLIISIPIYFIALVKIIYDLSDLTKMTNMGGHLAHIGGAIFGVIFIMQYKKGKDYSLWFNKMLSGKGKKWGKQSSLKVVHKRPKSDEDYLTDKNKKQEKLDAILDKIGNSGYDSLTKQEKDFLFKASND